MPFYFKTLQLILARTDQADKPKITRQAEEAGNPKAGRQRPLSWTIQTVELVKKRPGRQRRLGTPNRQAEAAKPKMSERLHFRKMILKNKLAVLPKTYPCCI